MARMIFMLVALIGTFQTLAAPLQSRAGQPSQQCKSFSLEASTGVEDARTALAAVNVATDPNARNLLQAQLSLLDAETGENELASSLSAGGGAASTGANALISALQAAQASLSQIGVLFIANTTFTAVATANASIATALENAQQAVAANC
ncbi:hypothetical protein MSAN_00638300 [Mycena sanguinolenta]|uniref:Uncharacterized protein n=1 Tax=Mycena sanguinolenta TaxID=230812 RepID=A0A8H6YZV1_9AGAR|nr:hypothetical protein MSAN_00638300 [Mycena sanguinolenta]